MVSRKLGDRTPALVAGVENKRQDKLGIIVDSPSQRASPLCGLRRIKLSIQT